MEGWLIKLLVGIGERGGGGGADVIYKDQELVAVTLHVRSDSTSGCRRTVEKGREVRHTEKVSA